MKAGLGYDVPESPDARISCHRFTVDAEERMLECIAPGAGVLPSTWDDTAAVSATGLVAGLSALSVGCGRIVISATANTTVGDVFRFYAVFYSSETPDATKIIGTSLLVSQEFSPVVNGASEKVAPHSTFANDCGASCVGIYVQELPDNGTVNIGISAI